MAQYDPAYAFVLQSETWSGACTVSADPTSANPNAQAVAGINSHWYPEDFAAIVALPEAERPAAVKAFYKAKFWDAISAGGIASQCLASHFLDSAVNQGQGTAQRLLQSAVNALRPETPLTVDGAIGPVSLEAINAADPDALLAAFTEQRLTLYASTPGTDQAHAAWKARAQKLCAG